MDLLGLCWAWLTHPRSSAVCDGSWGGGPRDLEGA